MYNADNGRPRLTVGLAMPRVVHSIHRHSTPGLGLQYGFLLPSYHPG